MNFLPISSAALAADALYARSAADAAQALTSAARIISTHLEQGRIVDAQSLRTAMTDAFGGSDAKGAWDWKSAYDACEAAQLLFLRKFGPAMRSHAGSDAAFLAMLTKLASLLPSHTRRSEELQALQQFSTPIALGLAASVAARLVSGDLVLEPSAGTGLLAIFAEIAGAGLVLNEIAETRSHILANLFPGVFVTQHDAAHIHDFLDASVQPSIVLMNPPFSAVVHVEGPVADAAFRHVASALARLCDGGRLVAITGASLSPENAAWRERFVRLQEQARIVFSAAIAGSVYARHGTTTESRLLVIDRVPADDPTAFPASRGTAPDAATLLEWVAQSVPPRAAIKLPEFVRPDPAKFRTSRPIPAKAARATQAPVVPQSVLLDYEAVDWAPADNGNLTEALYESYTLQSLRIPGATAHPTKLVQSAAMASVAPPKPGYRPHLPSTIVGNGLLSDAQLESIIYAGEAHSGFLAGAWVVDDTYDVVSAAPDDAENSVRFRRGWMLGDGTGAGKGRQVAGILLDNWCQGRTRAVWTL